MEAVVDRELGARGVDEAEIALVVVAERELVAVPGEEAVGLTGRVEPGAAELGAAAAPGVVGVRMPAPLPLGLAQRRRMAGVHRRAAVVRVQIGALLHRVGVGQPAEIVVEGAVLHHQDHEMVDRDVRRAGQPRCARLLVGGLREEQIQG